MTSRKLDAKVAIRRTQKPQVLAPQNELLDQFEVGRIVFDIQKCLRLPASRQRSCRRRFVRSGQPHEQGCGSALQFNPEHASDVDDAFGTDRASHQLNQSFRNHQTDAGAFYRTGFLAETIERLKQLPQLLRR